VTQSLLPRLPAPDPVRPPPRAPAKPTMEPPGLQLPRTLPRHPASCRRSQKPLPQRASRRPAAPGLPPSAWAEVTSAPVNSSATSPGTRCQLRPCSTALLLTASTMGSPCFCVFVVLSPPHPHGHGHPVPEQLGSAGQEEAWPVLGCSTCQQHLPEACWAWTPSLGHTSVSFPRGRGRKGRGPSLFPLRVLREETLATVPPSCGPPALNRAFSLLSPPLWDTVVSCSECPT
jgi:hypothetical protein